MKSRILTGAMALLLALSMTGCALSPPRAEAVPSKETSGVTIQGFSDIRYIVGDPSDMRRMRQEVIDAWRKQRLFQKENGDKSTVLPPEDILAISAGSDRGAFAAGLLAGWSKDGTRPRFSLVTGVSTGALIAPFAFLGREYDGLLQKLYTKINQDDIVKPRRWWQVITNDAIVDTTPLQALMTKYVTREMLDEIAKEYLQGRELWIATTNLDTRQGVIWNMTKIASYQDPKALKLFHEIMLASSAFPGAFPPVMFDAQMDGAHRQEMHVDGGISMQVFAYPPALLLNKLSVSNNNDKRQRNLYIIMNSKVVPAFEETKRRFYSIAARAVLVLIQSQSQGDLYRIYATSQRDKVGFHLVFIPESFQFEHAEEFDQKYMNALFQEGYQLGQTGDFWRNTPPGF